MATVQVVVRLRPMNDKEQSEGTLPVVTASTAKKQVTVIKGVGPKQARTSFSFDNVFTSFSTQQEVFTETLRPVIGDVLKGFETCVFAYGQVRKFVLRNSFGSDLERRLMIAKELYPVLVF